MEEIELSQLEESLKADPNIQEDDDDEETELIDGKEA